VILHGTLDKNTRPSGGQHFYDMASSTDKTLNVYD
jgi:acylglycerol lipase